MEIATQIIGSKMLKWPELKGTYYAPFYKM